MSVTLKMNIPAFSRHLRESVADVLNEGAESFVSLRKQLAPKDTGWMAERTMQTEFATPSSLSVRVVCDSSNNPHRGDRNEAYDALVEFGTVNSEAQPSVTPAWESARRQVNNRLLRLLK